MIRPLLTCLALAAPVEARAVDCSTLPPIVSGQPLSADQLECLRLDVVATDLRLGTCEARRAQADARAEACEATAAITCPPPALPPSPLGPAIVAHVIGIMVGAVLMLFVVR